MPRRQVQRIVRQHSPVLRNMIFGSPVIDSEFPNDSLSEESGNKRYQLIEHRRSYAGEKKPDANLDCRIMREYLTKNVEKYTAQH